jgi:hypothetical protein
LEENGVRQPGSLSTNRHPSLQFTEDAPGYIYNLFPPSSFSYSFGVDSVGKRACSISTNCEQLDPSARQGEVLGDELDMAFLEVVLNM